MVKLKKVKKTQMINKKIYADRPRTNPCMGL
jgi:hypothetical protein